MKAKTKTYVVNEDGKVSRWETFKARVRDKVDDAKEFYYDHEMEIKLAVPTLLVSGAWIVKKAVKAHQLSEEKELKELYIYDRSMGRYLKLKKPLTQGQMIIIETRKGAGERLFDILYDMDLLD